jgi:hypothetical protein
VSGSEKGFEYRADLSETTLPEMLYTVERFQVPGVIEAERDGVTKRVYVREGYVVHASSTDRKDSLGAYLQRTGKITAEQFTATMTARAGTKKRYGELLIEQGLISPAGIHEAIRKQVESIVWSLFYWLEGSVRFEIGTFQTPTDVRILLPMRQVVLQGIKGAPNAKALVARLGRKETVFEPNFSTEDLIRATIGEEEYALLNLIDGERSLYEVCHHGPLSAPENAKLVYAFHVLRLIRHREEARPQARDRAAADQQTERDDAASRPASQGIKIRFKTGADRMNGD